MPSVPEPTAGDTPHGDRPPLAAIVARALLYALAITALVIFAPGTEHVFIYQGF